MKKSKKLLSILLAVLLFASLLPLSALAANLPFRDVPADAWYYPVVKTAYEKGITNGVTRTTFEPNATVTREQFLVMLFRAAGFDLSQYEELLKRHQEQLTFVYNYTDVGTDTWYAAAVCCADEMRVTRGVDETHFGVGQPITREQMATMLERFMAARANAKLKTAENPVKAFADADQVSDWAKKGVEAMRVSGVMQGDELQRFCPQSNATRAEAAAVLLRLANATERCSIVPEGTAWIQIRNAEDLQDGSRHVDIKNPTDVQSMIRYLDNMPVAAETVFPAYAGWTYDIRFYDENDQYLCGYEFMPNFIRIGANIGLTSLLPYFLPWTLMI